MPIQKFQQLEAWQLAHQLVLATYRACRCLPSDERFGLQLQMRRAAVSVPANIAEGFKRRTSKDKLHFYNISESSLEELKYYFILCRDLEYWNETQADRFLGDADRASQVLSGLVRSLCP